MAHVAFYSWNQAGDLRVQVVEEGTVKLKQLQILGKPGISSGLAIFQSAATSAEPSAPQQVLGCCSGHAVLHIINNCHELCNFAEAHVHTQRHTLLGVCQYCTLMSSCRPASINT